MYYDSAQLRTYKTSCLAVQFTVGVAGLVFILERVGRMMRLLLNLSGDDVNIGSEEWIGKAYDTNTWRHSGHTEMALITC